MYPYHDITTGFEYQIVLDMIYIYTLAQRLLLS